MNVSDEDLMKIESSLFYTKYKENEINTDLIHPLLMNSDFLDYEVSLNTGKSFNSKTVENENENIKRCNSNDNNYLSISSEKNKKFHALQLKKGIWSLEEDKKLYEWVKMNGPNNWKNCVNFVGRISKQCRERWYNVLNPFIRKGNWTKSEDKLLFDLYERYGTKWSKISKFFKGRTENSLKNRFYSTLRKYSNVKNITGRKMYPKDLCNYIPKIKEEFNLIGLKRNEKPKEKKISIDDFINSYSLPIETDYKSSTVNNNFINSVSEEYNKLTEDSLEKNLKSLCETNPFKEKIPIENLINFTVDEFVDSFFQKKNNHELEFCGKCLIPKAFEKLEREKTDKELIEEDNKEFDRFLTRMNEVEELMKETISELKELRQYRDSNSL
jgi:hypothetical protein